MAEAVTAQIVEHGGEKSKELHLYIVIGRSYDRQLNRLYNHGSDGGEAREFSPSIVVATSDEAAINNLWNRMTERCDRHFATADRIIGEVNQLKKEGKFEEAERRSREAVRAGGELGPLIPEEPKDKERWRAWQVYIPKGYRLIRDPTAEAAPIVVDPSAENS
ncbi:MAG TPA: hypothetical protein VMU07_02920 [Candidatus Paceibacterota bacterium]|nr:hypothetical protein [Candidatus Paceibacterota bacterium]